MRVLKISPKWLSRVLIFFISVGLIIAGWSIQINFQMLVNAKNQIISTRSTLLEIDHQLSDYCLESQAFRLENPKRSETLSKCSQLMGLLNRSNNADLSIVTHFTQAWNDLISEALLVPFPDLYRYFLVKSGIDFDRPLDPISLDVNSAPLYVRGILLNRLETARNAVIQLKN